MEQEFADIKQQLQTCIGTEEPSLFPTLQPTFACQIPGYTPCISYRCTQNNENPNCDIELSYGCISCIDGYFKPSWDVACLECSNIVNCNITNGCNEFTGCNRCNNGFQRVFSPDCEFFVCV